ncbi:MAG: maleate cis-trans isomerase family protein [Actinomycetes bacterium]
MTGRTTAVGFLYPGYAAEDDYPRAERMLGGGVALPLVHTSVGEDAHRVDALLDLGGTDRLAEGAEGLRTHGVAAVVWACTSGSFVFGWDGARAQADALGGVLGVPASSTSFAFVHAARALGLHRVVVAATYPQDVAESFVAFLEAGHVEVLSLASRDIITAAEVGTLGREDVLAFAAAHDHPEAEAVLLPDTALHSIAWLDDLEQRLDKPVLTANQVSIWEGLRLAGHPVASERLGALFRHRAGAPTV